MPVVISCKIPNRKSCKEYYKIVARAKSKFLFFPYPGSYIVVPPATRRDADGIMKMSSRSSHLNSETL